MVIEINIPNVGDDELEVTEILVAIGDYISINQPLLVIEGDKLSMEVPSTHSGTITKIHTYIGDQVHTGSLIISLDTDNHIIQQPVNNNKSILQDTVISESNFIDHKQSTCDIMYHNNVPDKCDNIKSTSNLLIHATPVIRRIARKFGIDLSKIKGSGRKGRILKEDIQNYLNISEKNTHYNNDSTIIVDQMSSDNITYSKINFNKFGKISITKLSKIQKISGTNLQKSWSTIPHVTQFDIVDVTNLEIFRKQQNLEIEKKKMNFKITMLVFIIKTISKVLEELPRFNSSLSPDGHSLILKKYINIGIAVDTKKGLLVPVLRDANKKGIIKLSQELSEISQKARSGNQLTLFDIQGGSFTISNLGGIGGTAFTPIINSPEVAILGISKSSMRPVWTGKKFIPRLMLPLSLSYDHRVIDGADGARFISLVNKMISDIRLLSM